MNFPLQLQGLRVRPKVLSFDVYGTLIDWETGLNNTLQALFSAHGLTLDESSALSLFAHHEARTIAGDYLPYRDVLAQTLDRMGESLGFVPNDTQRRDFVESIRDWPTFQDSRNALLRLQPHFKLAVITNCDDEHFAISNRLLGIDFDVIITAEQARSYKPSKNNFLLALGSFGVSAQHVLHVAESLFHDHAPAQALGVPSVWIRRRHAKAGHGASPVAPVQPAAQFISMTDFADAVLAQMTAGEP